MGEPKIVLPATSTEALARLAAGGRVVARSWGAELSATNVDTGTLARAQDVVRGVAALRELIPADRDAVLALDRATQSDYPGDIATAHQPLTPAQATPGAHRRAFGADIGGDLVAMTFVDVHDTHAETDFTAVATPWRNRGFATAVKALSVDVLLSAGVQRFRTGGSSDNVAVIAANTALGYVRDEEWVTIEQPDPSSVAVRQDPAAHP